MFEWIKNLFGSPKALKECEAAKQAYWNTIDSMNNTLNLNKKELETKDNEIKILNGQVIELQGQIPTSDPMETFWNNKYPKQKIFYSGRCLPNQTDRTFETDVRIFFTPFDQQLIDTVNATWVNIGKPSEGSNDDKALKCLKWVRQNFKYVSDKETTGLTEFWMFPFEALRYKKGDCDDGAILLANLMLCAGIPYYRIRLNAGNVTDSRGGKLGHCYVTYLRETDNQFIVLDWCYWYSDKPIKDRALHKDERNYFSIWFSWNTRYAFGEMTTMTKMDKRRFNGKKWK